MKSVANNSWVKCDELRIEVLRVKTVFDVGERITGWENIAKVLGNENSSEFKLHLNHMTFVNEI